MSPADPSVTTAIKDLARDLAALAGRVATLEAAFGVPPPRELRVSARPASVTLARALGRAGASLNPD